MHNLYEFDHPQLRSSAFKKAIRIGLMDEENGQALQDHPKNALHTKNTSFLETWSAVYSFVTQQKHVQRIHIR